MSGYVTTDFERGMDVGRQVVAVQLKDENAELRELVHDMGFLIAWSDWKTAEDDERAYQLVCRAVEMGIEVCT